MYSLLQYTCSLFSQKLSPYLSVILFFLIVDVSRVPSYIIPGVTLHIYVNTHSSKTDDSLIYLELNIYTDIQYMYLNGIKHMDCTECTECLLFPRTRSIKGFRKPHIVGTDGTCTHSWVIGFWETQIGACHFQKAFAIFLFVWSVNRLWEVHGW